MKSGRLVQNVHVTEKEREREKKGEKKRERETFKTQQTFKHDDNNMTYDVSGRKDTSLPYYTHREFGNKQSLKKAQTGRSKRSDTDTERLRKETTLGVVKRCNTKRLRSGFSLVAH